LWFNRLEKVLAVSQAAADGLMVLFFWWLGNFFIEFFKDYASLSTRQAFGVREASPENSVRLTVGRMGRRNCSEFWGDCPNYF